MAKLATCPGCTSQLALPEEATLSDRARCPRCGEQFLLMESVQFSIPNAEILPPEPTAEVEMPGTIGPDTYLDSPSGHDYYSEPAAREAASEPETFEPQTFEPQTFESQPLPANATLSDWEARLKRAISSEPDIESEAAERLMPSPYAPPEYSSFKPSEETPSEHVTVPADDDFSISAADFKPQSEYSSQPPVDEWAAEDEYEPETRRAADARTSFDSIDDEVLVGDAGTMDQEIAVDVNSCFATRKKRKRSLARTLASASFGVIGIPLGLYALLWLRGPAGDVLHLAQYVPSFMLPPSFNELDGSEPTALLADEPEAVTTNDAATALLADDADEKLSATELAEAEIAEARIADERPEVRNDPEVAPASAETPGSVIDPLPKFSLVDPAEFAELLAAAQQAEPQLVEGDLNSKESVAKKGQAYMTLARLAEKCSYFDQPGLNLDQSTQVALAQQFFRTTLRKDHVKRDLPQIALRWWQYPQRPSPGMLLIGKVERLQTSDTGTIVFVSLGIDGVAPAIPVLVPSTDIQEGELIGVVGSIMADPQEQLGPNDSLTGPVLVSYYSFPLEPFTEDPAGAAADADPGSPLPTP